MTQKHVEINTYGRLFRQLRECISEWRSSRKWERDYGEWEPGEYEALQRASLPPQLPPLIPHQASPPPLLGPLWERLPGDDATYH